MLQKKIQENLVEYVSVFCSSHMSIHQKMFELDQALKNGNDEVFKDKLMESMEDITRFIYVNSDLFELFTECLLKAKERIKEETKKTEEEFLKGFAK